MGEHQAKTVADLLFELASSDRLAILREVDRSPMKLSQVARKLAATPQEASRQLGRLAEAKLIERNSEGSYSLTSFGRVALFLVPSFAFLSEESEYLLSHDLSSLPLGYLQRIGDLMEHERVDLIDDMISFEDRVLKEANQYIWYMVDQLFGYSLHEDRAHGDDLDRISLRMVLPKSISPDVLGRIRGSLGGRFEIGITDEVKVAIVMNEQMAGVAFPALDGRIDYGRGFTGKTPRFHRWCHDLCTEFWNISKKR